MVRSKVRVRVRVSCLVTSRSVAKYGRNLSLNREKITSRTLAVR